MANKNFQSRVYSFDHDAVMLEGRITVGAAGAVSGLAGSGFSAITKETGDGKYSFTLSDKYNRLLNAQIMTIAAQSPSTPVTSVTGTFSIQSLTFPALAAATSGDHVILYDASGAAWGISLDKTGSAPQPTGALWTAIPAGKKCHVNISAATTGSDVAAAVETAFDLLVSNPWATTTTTDTIACTNNVRAVLTAAVPYKSDETGVGSITVAQTLAGVNSSVEFAANNTFTVVNHGFKTGQKIQASISGGGTLPTGITTSTDYYIIKVDANNFKLAASLANAEAGTAITITSQGTETKTITYTSFAPFGSGVCTCELTDVAPETAIAAGSKVTFTTYDYAGNAINPLIGSMIFIKVLVRNSSIKGKGE